MFDTQGLVVAGRPGLPVHKLPYTHQLAPSKPFNHLDLASEYPQILVAIEDFKPTALIGLSTVGKLFSREIVEAMSAHNARPIIFAPTFKGSDCPCHLFGLRILHTTRHQGPVPHRPTGDGVGPQQAV